ncbi:phosphopentomutase [Clostridium acetobutylicum]|uniref:Phosphopentomutase n=1 Tax=Clostridium acetobutylicum (strain ATCC 824 / DSM 792 / JCM 1419 / IAM 19013 / LMG 5710 / NBRC 13948 / NRRL B-527 / VKM B-1787 / 2291 / W) TaxID=272562 RepID=DEOB_CLOAB|nr:MULTISPECIES: phosphopentomutase [Clostridium]Q97HE6.1 RecName: Full=Phosphopentomutase; AltName: Full=Phosphodeoxyribomutase [Clostridium acetobutylicum ATCC 824]AAK80024.1 Phosphopentomutase [Clostridium acetobutylicum ATCC 824]ADZ21116.1 phosphopentomutase [Clostridium acetobutylicum EA 2018]AEI33477.1 phosphopentomutase [Clostridium acetobutylicum DSM 1731]AWV79547.1 phosphopentomutase [Clostridium acetobutylicum]MBC2394479.1 phosphopentomutase [Clostridium acetobutylicum]
MVERVILIVLDSVGAGEMPDADKYGDKGSDTIGNISKAVGGLKLPDMVKMGLGNISGIKGVDKVQYPIGAFGKLKEMSKGKDTVTGHWEMSGVILEEPLNTYPNGFPKDIIDEFEKKIGRKVIGNKVASGTEIIKELGDEHIKTGCPIVYTSADSVFQVAAHEEIIPLDELYKICKVAREMLVDDRTVGRVIARPFVGKNSNYTRTSNRRDFALDPFNKTMLEYIKENKSNVMCVGKIEDIFNKKGVTEAVHIKNNMDGVDKTLEYMKTDKKGLIFTNLVDFDMLYGHRNDPKGYAKALEEFDGRINEIKTNMKDYDVLMITADHGCDPTTESTDHSREYIPFIAYGKDIKGGADIKIRDSFSDIGKTILDLLQVENNLVGKSFKDIIMK